MLYLEEKYYDEVKRSEAFSNYYDRTKFYEENPGIIMPTFNFSRLKYCKLDEVVDENNSVEVDAVFEPYLSQGIIHDTTAPKKLAEVLSFFLKSKEELGEMPDGHQFFLHEDFEVIPYEVEPSEISDYELSEIEENSEEIYGLKKLGVNYILVEGGVFRLPTLYSNCTKKWVKINVVFDPVDHNEMRDLPQSTFTVYLKKSDYDRVQGEDRHTVYIELVQPEYLDYGYYY